MRGEVVFTLWLALAAGRAGAFEEDERPWLAGASVAVDPRSGDVLVAESDEGVVAVSSPGARLLRRKIKIGGAPEQLVIAPDGTTYATLRGSGEVAAIAPGGAEVARRAAVGREPFGLALSPDGVLLFVTVAGSAEVVALDARSLDERFRVSVDPEPRAVAALADGSMLVVSHLTGRSVSVIELPRFGRPFVRALSPPTRIALATIDKQRFGIHDSSIVQVPNLAYAIAPAVDRRRVYVPHAVEDTGGGILPERRVATYGAGAPEPVLPALSTIDVDAEVAFPDKQLGPWRSPPSFGKPKDVCLDRINQPRAAVLDARAGRLYVAGFGSDDVTAFKLEPDPGDPAFCVKLPRGSGPKGLALSADREYLYVHLAFKHELLAIRIAAIGDSTKRLAIRNLTVGRETLPAAAVRGRRIFFSAGDERQSDRGHLPCATCHPEGRQDGLTWRLDQGPRQTPILAGRLVGTAPYNWRGTGDTLEHNFVETVRRLGGSGLEARDLADLELFVTRYLGPAPSRAPRDAPEPELPKLPRLADRGRALFVSDELGCAHCHDPARRFTDGKTHDVGSISAEERGHAPPATPDRPAAPAPTRLAYKTPSLIGVGAGAPYFHDGSAATLRAVVTTGNPGDRMGRTSQLAPADVDALVAYLGTL